MPEPGAAWSSQEAKPVGGSLSSSLLLRLCWGSKHCPKVKRCSHGPLLWWPASCCYQIHPLTSDSWSRSDNCIRAFLIIPQQTHVHLGKKSIFCISTTFPKTCQGGKQLWVLNKSPPSAEQVLFPFVFSTKVSIVSKSHFLSKEVLMENILLSLFEADTKRCQEKRRWINPIGSYSAH